MPGAENFSVASVAVLRPDLGARTDLSKSALTVFDLCGQKAWFEIHRRIPFIPNPDMTFGSAVDAGVENILTAVRAGIPGEAQPMEAAAMVVARDGIEIHMDEVERALEAFVRDIVPTVDWNLCRLQAHLHEDMEDWGEVDGHPDIVLASRAVWDVKTSKRAKETARTVELGLYALMVETETGQPVPEVGYFNWTRTSKPRWQVISTEISEDFRAWTRARVGAYVRAKRADAVLNRTASVPVNWTFPSGPRNGRLCANCQYNPLFGGPCSMASTDGDESDA